MVDGVDVAEYILCYCEKSLLKPITNMQLQRFLYYIQGIHLAKKNEPLFCNQMEAWHYGIVVPDVYYWFNKNESKPIVGVKPINDVLSDFQKELVECVCKRLIDVDIWQLNDIIKSQSPYGLNRLVGSDNKVLIEDVEDFFKKYK